MRACAKKATRPGRSWPGSTTQTCTGAISAAARPALAEVTIDPVAATAATQPVTVACSEPKRSRSATTSA